MNNAQLIAKAIIVNKGEGIIIHTLPGRPEWLVAEKLAQDKWNLILMRPEQNIQYNVGTINNKEHNRLIFELINAEINQKIKSLELAKQMKQTIKNFKKREIYQKLIKIK